MKHPEAVTLTCLLVAAKGLRALDYPTHDVIAEYFADWPDEQKADLYSLLEDRVKAAMALEEMEQVVSRCLWDNLNWWADRG